MTRPFIISIVCVLISLAAVLPSPAIATQDGRNPNPPSERTPVFVERINFSNGNPNEDDKIVIRGTLRNNESREISNITAVFLMDGTEIGNISGLKIEGNGSLVVEQTWWAKKYNHTVSILVNLNGQTLKDSQLSKGIYVEPTPIGDFTTPILLLALLMLMIFLTGVSPSIVERIVNRGFWKRSKY